MHSCRGADRLVPLLLVLAALAAPGFAATGGPDMFGYTWIDVLEPAGPTFMGVDISMTGMPIVVGDDVTSASIPLGRPIDFYGTEYSQLALGSNGFLTDDTGAGGDLSNDCPLPASPSTGGGMRIYPLHDDLDLEAGFGEGFFQYFAACPRPADRASGTVGCSVFMWNDVSHFPGGAAAQTWDQWVYLYDNCDIVIEIGAGNPDLGSGSTTGIQNDGATDGLTVACNTPMSVPDNYVVLFEHPCVGASGTTGFVPTTSLVISGPTVIDADLGTVGGVPDPAYLGNGIFSYIDIDIQAGALVTFTGATAPDLRATGNITIDGDIDLDGANGMNSANGQPGGTLVPGVAGGGFGGTGACGVLWESRLGMRGGGTTGGFGGTHPPGSGGFADVTGGGGGGNGTVGIDGAPPVGAFMVEVGRGGCANVNPLTTPLRGGGGGGGGGCDVDAATPVGSGTANDGGSSGGSGGGAIRLQAGGNLTVGAGASVTADGGSGGDNTGNGAAAGGGAGGTVLLLAGGDVTFDGTFSTTGGLGGVPMQAGAGAAGGAGGDGIIGMYDSDGVIAGTGVATPAAITGTTPIFGSGDLVIVNKDLPNASPTEPYAATIAASGGTGAYTFSVTGGALPGSLAIDAMTGLISGTSSSTASTRDEFIITVDDGVTTYDRAFCVLTQDTALAIATDSLPATGVMTAYMATVTVVGGAGSPTFAIADGALPTGLSLDTMTGAISGMTGPNFETATFAVSVADAVDENDVQTYCIVVGGVPSTVPLITIPNAEECQPYNVTLMPTAGAPPYTYDVFDMSLPMGVMFDPMTGNFSGAPAPGSSMAGPYNLCVHIYDAAGFVGKTNLDIIVDPAMTPPTCFVQVDPNLTTPLSAAALPIPDNDAMGIFDTIPVAVTDLVQDLRVDVAITHTFVGDIRIELTHVNSGTTAVLLDQPGVPATAFGCPEDNIVCAFTDRSTRVGEDLCDAMPPAIGGMVQPVDPLAIFLGLDMASDWQLMVSDNAGGDTGTLDSWGLTLNGVPVPQGGSILVQVDPQSGCDPTVELLSIEFSLDGGVSFVGPCTPAATSPLMPPQMGVPVGMLSDFLWNSTADGVAPMSVEMNVVLRATVQDLAGMGTCDTIVFSVDNQCLCGDCDGSGALPPTVLDALTAAQLAAGLMIPTALQQRCCDVDSSGPVISVLDALLMAQAAAGLPVSISCP